MNSIQIGRFGEERIHQLLPGSEYINEDFDQHLPYDLIWEGIKIDVKTTARLARDSIDSCSFNAHRGKQDVLLIFYAKIEGQEYVWIDNAQIKTKKLSDTVDINRLPESIYGYIGKLYTPLEAKRRISVYVSPEEYRELHAKLVLEGKSISSWVREKITQFLYHP